MIKTFPHFSIWHDEFKNCFEVVRWDTAMKYEIVETNILSRGKAYASMFEWRKRAKILEEKNA